MLSTLIAAAAIIQSETPQDFHLPVMTLASYGNWLSEKVGKPVIVLPGIQDQLIYIHLHQRTLRDLMGFVEESIAVESLDKNGVITLQPKPRVVDEPDAEFAYWEKNLAARERTDFSAARLEEVMREATRLQSQMGDSWDNEIYQKLADLNQYDPAAIALNRAVRRMGQKVFENMERFQRVVYSTDPTSMQKPWPGDRSADLKSMNEMLTLKAQLLAKLKAEQSRETVNYYFDGVLSDNRSAEPAAAMTLAVKRDVGNCVFQLKCFDKDGTLICENSNYLAGLFDEDAVKNLTGFPESLQFKEKFKLTDAEKEELQFASMLYAGDTGTGRTFKPEDIERLAQIDKIEPLGGAFTRILDRICHLLNDEVVTTVTSPYVRVSKDSNEVDMSEVAFSLLGDFSALEKGFPKDQLVLHTADIYGKLMGKRSLPRQVLARAAREILRAGDLNLDILADAVKAVPDDQLAGLTANALVSLSGQSSGYMRLNPGEWSLFVLRAYAELPPQMRRQALTSEGLTLALNNTPGQIRTLFQQMVHQAEMVPGITESSDYRSIQVPQENIGLSDWMREQTVFLTQGFAQPITLHFAGGSEQSFLAELSYSGFTSRQVMDMESITEQIAMNEAAQKQGQRSFGSTITGLAPCQQSQLTLTITPGKVPASGYQLALLAKPPVAMVPIEKLPESMRAEFEKSLAEKRKTYEQVRFGSGSGQTPPPPPAR